MTERGPFIGDKRVADIVAKPLEPCDHGRSDWRICPHCNGANGPTVPLPEVEPLELGHPDDGRTTVQSGSFKMTGTSETAVVEAVDPDSAMVLCSQEPPVVECRTDGCTNAAGWYGVPGAPCCGPCIDAAEPADGIFTATLPEVEPLEPPVGDAWEVQAREVVSSSALLGWDNIPRLCGRVAKGLQAAHAAGAASRDGEVERLRVAISTAVALLEVEMARRGG